MTVGAAQVVVTARGCDRRWDVISNTASVDSTAGAVSGNNQVLPGRRPSTSANLSSQGGQSRQWGCRWNDYR
jgi:hypothetical protein